jgi:hypothetical protein
MRNDCEEDVVKIPSYVASSSERLTMYNVRKSLTAVSHSEVEIEAIHWISQLVLSI